MLRFHQATCELLGMVPLVDKAARAAIDDRERRLGVKIPAAVAEWYRLRAAVEILAGDSADDVVAIGELGEPFDGWGSGRRDFVREGLLVIRIENQGVCHWAVPLEDGDDPRVLVEVDSPPDRLVWQLHAPSFSGYVFTLAWDRLAFGLPYGLAAQDGPLGQQDLALLEQRFVRRPSTYAWPGRVNFRFERGDQRVVVWNADGFDHDDPRAEFGGQADWWLHAGTAASLASLAGELRGCGGLATRLYAVSGGAPAEQVVSDLRAAGG
jgi:hypothetical protein